MGFNSGFKGLKIGRLMYREIIAVCVLWKLVQSTKLYHMGKCRVSVVKLCSSRFHWTFEVYQLFESHYLIFYVYMRSKCHVSNIFLRMIIFLTWDRPFTFNTTSFPLYLYLKIKNYILRSNNLLRCSVFHTESTSKIVFCSPLDLKIKLNRCPVQVKAVTSCVVVMSVCQSVT